MVAEQTYLIPSTIAEAITYAQENAGNFKYLAGGTDIMANLFQENETSNCLIDISGIKELKEINSAANYFSIGSLLSLDDLKNINFIKTNFPSILDAAISVGSPIIRKSATIGGNLLCENRCIYYNQSEWWRESAGNCLKCGGDICIATQGKKSCFSEIVSDMAPALISLDAEIELYDIGGNTKIKLEDLYTGDGVQPRNISETAIITSILLPQSRAFKTVFKKLRQRKSLEFTSLTTAVSTDNNGKVKIALGGVDPKVVVVEGTINDNKDELIKRCIKGSRAVNNDMFTRDYRRKMIKVYLEKAFIELGL
jgi:4-hydroxybenzoyl-CoA reductase subunit beta